MSLNLVTLMGRLTRDPELRHTPSNIPVATFSLAVDRNYKSKQEGAQNTDFFDIVAWRHNAEFVSKFFTKGKQVIVVGSLQTRTWEDKNGNNRRTVEIVGDKFCFADSKGSGERTPEAQSVYPDDDDELPFD